MKISLSFMIILLAFSASAQELNKKKMDASHAREILINNCTRDSLVAFPEFKTSFDPNYAAYSPDAGITAQLKSALKDTKITVVMGTWCGDSKLVVPHFYKMLDVAKIKTDNINLICVDGSKHAENGILDNMKIERVPTFIFTDKNGQELGRITEHPSKTLESDMLAILTAKK